MGKLGCSLGMCTKVINWAVVLCHEINQTSFTVQIGTGENCPVTGIVISELICKVTPDAKVLTCRTRAEVTELN